MSELPVHAVNPPVFSLSPATGTGDANATDASKEKEEQEKLEKRRSTTNIVSMIVMGVSIVVIVLELITIAKFYDNESQRTVGVMYAATITGIILAPTVIFKQYILQRLDTLRCVHNKIRMEVNRMTEVNNELHRNVDGLEVEVQRVQNAEQELSSIMEGSNKNVDDILQAVQENRKLIDRQGELARAAFQEQLLTSVLRTDKNQDLKITGKEVDLLVLRMRKHDGIRLNEEEFRNKIEESQGSIGVIMDLLRELGDRSGSDDDGDGSGNEGQKQRKLIQVDEKALIKSHGGVQVKEDTTSGGFEVQIQDEGMDDS